MKKHVIFNFLFLFLFSASSFGTVKFIMGNYTAAPGAQVTVPVKVKDFLNVVSAQGTIQFNQSIVSYVSVQNFGLPGMSNSSFGTSQISNGKLTFSWFDGSLAGVSLPDSATLFTIKFNVMGTAGQVSALSFINSPTVMEVNDVSFNTLPLAFQNGSVTVQSAAPSNNVTLKIDTVSGTQGSQVLVSVRAVNFTGMTSMQGTIQFNPSVASYGGISFYGLPGMNSSNFGTSQIASGKLTFSWFDGTLTGQSVASNAPLFTIRFNLTGSPGSQTILNFASSPTPLEVTDAQFNVAATNTVDGKIKITGAASAQTLRLGIDTVSGPTSSQVVVPVRAWHFNRILSAQGTISFNTAVATFAGTQQYGLPGMSASSFGTSQTGSGKLMFSWTDGTLNGQSVADSSVIFAVLFNVVGLPGDITPLTFINSHTPVEVIDTSFNAVTVTLQPGHIRVSGSVTITTGNPAATVYCGGDSVAIGYSAIGAFNAGNNFILQLSDAAGSFAAPAVIATIGSTTLSGTFHTVLPLSTVTGTGYRFRVVSTNSAITGSDNGTNITINQLPAAPAIPSGTASLCVNAVNTTYTISAVAGAASYSWSLSPAAAGTITPSGTSAVVDWNDTFTGTAQVSVSAANGACQGASSPALTVSINALAGTPGAISGLTTLCSGTTTTYSVTNDAAATGYTWTIPGSWSGTSTANSISVVTGAGSGTISVAANNGCGSSPAQTLAVTVTDVPAIPGTIAGTTTICAGSSNTYSTTAVSGATGYTWTLPGGWAGTSATNSINAASGTSGGTITVTADNSCGSSTTQTLAIAVDNIPASPATIAGPIAICAGNNATYSVTTVAGATDYTWALPGGWTGTSTTNSIFITTGSSGGTVTVTANNLCGSSTAQTLAVAIDLLPPGPGVISGATTICAGTINTYSTAPVAGASSYTWTLPGDWTGTSTTNSITATAGSTSGSVSVVVNNGCGSSTAQTLAVAVNTAPASPATITGATAVCEGSTNIYSVVDVAGATGYTWTLPGGWTGTSTGDSITSIASDTSGTITVTADNACGSSTAQTLTIVVNTVPINSGAISGAPTACSGSSNTYSVVPVAGATSYTWILPGGWSGTSTTNSITTTVTMPGGNIAVAANNSCGNSTLQDLAVTVDTIPAVPAAITGAATICSGNTIIYSVADVPGASGYSWTLPGSWTGTSTTDSITVTAGMGSGTIAVTADNACGSSAAQTLAITVNTIPASPGTITGITTVCSGSSNIYSVVDVAGATGYTWTLPGGWAGTGSTDSITTIASDTSGTIAVTADNACGSSSAQTLSITVNTVPAAPLISGPASICAGSNATYSVSPVAGATGYTWTLPGGWTGTSTADTISLTPDDTSGTITLIIDNSCGSSMAGSFNVIIDTLPANPGAISGSANICSGSTGVYSLAAVPGAISYTWTLPGSWSGTSTTDSITAVAGTSGGTVSVFVTNGCGNSAPQVLAVTVNPVPASPIAITGPTIICSGSSTIYSVADVPDATVYIWTLPGGWSGASSTDSITTIASDTSGTITVTAGNACGSSAAQTLAVAVNTVPASPVITGPASICSGNSVIYSVTNVPGATGYTWTLPLSWSGGGSTDSISTTADTSGTITVTADNSCGSSTAQTLAVAVDTLPPVAGAITGATTICSGSSNTYSTTAIAGATGYTWTLPGGWLGTSSADSITIIASDTSGTVAVSAANSCGNGATQTFAVMVNLLPIVVYTQTPSTVCADNTSLLLTGAAPAGGTFSGTAVTDSTFDASLAGTGTYTITYTYTDTNTCTNTATSAITVDPCTGIRETVTAAEIMLYPNPTTSSVTINGAEVSAELTVYNTIGKVILKQVVTEEKTVIDLSREASEVYLLKIVTSKGIVLKRIVKQ